MRLFELLENVPQSDTQTPISLPSPPGMGSSRIAIKGQGSFARVFQDRDNPHEVMKFSLQGYVPHGGQKLANEDGYIKYLREIAANEEIQDNPWVPRILGFRLHKNNAGDVVDYTARVEALQPFDSLSADEILAMSERTFKPPYFAKIERSISRYVDKQFSATIGFISMMNACINAPGEASEITQDDHLVEFTHWHAAAHKRNQCYLDIRQPNIMIRRLPYGAQPVITDPWA